MRRLYAPRQNGRVFETRQTMRIVFHERRMRTVIHTRGWFTHLWHVAKLLDVGSIYGSYATVRVDPSAKVGGRERKERVKSNL